MPKDIHQRDTAQQRSSRLLLAMGIIVLLGARMPCVLVEVGYCSNPHEARNLLDARYRMILAEGLAEGILSYRDRVRQNRTAQNSLTPPASGAM